MEDSSSNVHETIELYFNNMMKRRSKHAEMQLCTDEDWTRCRCVLVGVCFQMICAFSVSVWMDMHGYPFDWTMIMMSWQLVCVCVC